MEDTPQSMDPRYLRGVIEALELVQSFLAWKAQHPDSHRTIKQFIQQALSNLEKKTESKLDEVLGIDLEE